MTTLTYSGTLTVVTCWCGTSHAVPSELREFQERQHRDGRDQQAIYCPLGHTHIIAGEGEAAQLRKQLEREASRAQATRDLLRQEERSHSATKGQLTKARKRAAAGVCPCCNRTFQNVARHVKTKHPDFEQERAES